MFEQPDLAIRWPVDLVVDEVRASDLGHEFARMLDEIFVGDDILARFKTGEWGGIESHVSERDLEQRLRIFVLKAARTGRLSEAKPRVPLYRQRITGRQPTDSGVDRTKRLATGFESVIYEMDGSGYFDRLTSRPCVDDTGQGHSSKPTLDTAVAKDLGTYIDLQFLNRWVSSRSSAQQDLYEYEWGGSRKIIELGEDELYELIEVLHDLAARPRIATFHDYGGCGYHYSHFSISAGQRLYRWRVNRLLDENGVPLELISDGELEGRLSRKVDDGRARLVDAAVANASASEVDEVKHAIAGFNARGATRQDKRSAITTLARLLENERALLKSHLFKKDEGALFRIANEFDLRHSNETQMAEYGDAFLDWIFWWYLATVELAQQLRTHPD